MADNVSSVQDAHGDYDDWIELYNNGDTSVDVAGYYLSDDLANLAKWPIPVSNPAATTIPAHGRLLIWADNEAEQGLLYANFKLSAGGESIALYDPQGNLLDSVTFGAQDPDVSYGRLPDGTGQWQQLPTATPGKSNQAAPARVVLSEIMFHPYHAPLTPEDTTQEWIELSNGGASPVDMTGWRLNDGVDFVFPAVVLEPGAYVVVAANVNVFLADHPGVTNIIGGWAGWLGNSGERIRLVDEVGAVINEVRYADEGDWTIRELGPVDHSQRGWYWSDASDGGGKSLELVDTNLPNEYGQNWAASTIEGGTPGRANSVALDDSAPMILDVHQRPLIPGPSDPVWVAARIFDDQATGVTVTLHYRLDASTYTDQNVYPTFDAASYLNIPMSDDGMHGDGQASDGVFGAAVPPQADGGIIEFYVQAEDSAGHRRTWPAPAMVDGAPQQVTNALYQVDGSFDPTWTPGSQPVYYLIMSEAERARLADIGNGTGGPGSEDDSDSDAQMNGTFISVDGAGVELHYRVGIRNRGKGSRDNAGGNYRNNYRVSFTSDDPWKGVGAINLKARYGHVAVLGSAVWRMANLPAERISPIQVRVNGQNLAQTSNHMFGAYASVEVMDGEYVANHFPCDPDGNLYRGMNDTADLGYDGTNPAKYYGPYPKQTNAAANDYSDLIHLTYVLNDTPADRLFEEAGKVLRVEEWCRHLAVDALSGNREGGLTTPRGDDYALYSGARDTRFWLLAHDLDTLFGQGDTSPDINRDIHVYAGLDGLHELLSDPTVLAIYYGQLKSLIDTVFSPAQFDPLVDRILGDYVPEATRTQIKQFVVQRDAAVLAQIAREPIVPIAPQPEGPALGVPPVDISSRPLVINEVLANNVSAVASGDAYPGMVELYYDGPNPLDLSDKTMTNDPNNPARFIFPASTTMAPGERLVLYADADAMSPGLHLGFALADQGDALYLCAADGTLIDSVEFGPQLPDLSISRVGPLGDEWKLTIPTLGRANEADVLLGDPHAVRINEWLASEKVLLTSDFVELYNPNVDPVDLGGMILTDNPAMPWCRGQIRPLSFVAGHGYGVFWADSSDAPGHVGFRLSAEGELIALFDREGVEVDKVIFSAQTTDFSEGRTPDGTDDIEILPLPTPGVTNPQLAKTVTSTVVLLSEQADKRVLVPTGPVSDTWKGGGPFDDSAWTLCTGAPGGVGYEAGHGYESLITLDTKALMYGSGKNNSCYVRIPFTVTGDTLADAAALTLKVRRDDGFVAYLNGTEVARANFTGTPAWNSHADSAGESVAEGFDDYIDLSAFIGDLKVGTNLLAIHAMNAGTSSSDFLINAEVDAVSAKVVGQTTCEREASLLDGLRITELMYHAPQGSSGDYVELVNVSNETLDVNGVRFIKGISFTFPAMTLSPGQCALVVADETAFRAAYGAGLNVAGQYRGNLSNDGEDLILQLPVPYDAAILRFSYSNAWYPSTDGGGDCLAIDDPVPPAVAWGQAASWHAAPPTPGRP